MHHHFLIKNMVRVAHGFCMAVHGHHGYTGART